MIQDQNTNPNPNRGANKYFSTRCVALYNNETSAMTLSISSDGFGKKFASIQLAPVFSDMKGKEAPRGEQMYDYDHTTFVSLAAEDTVRFIKALELISSDSSKFADFELTQQNKASMRICSLASAEKDSSQEGSFILFVTREDKTEAFKFAKDEISVYSDTNLGLPEGNDFSKIALNPSFEVFKEWFKNALKEIVGAVDYPSLSIRRMNGSAGAASANSGRSSSSYTSPVNSRRSAGASAEKFNSWKNGGASAEKPTETVGNEVSGEDAPSTGDLPF
jgi:hypothetical protein